MRGRWRYRAKVVEEVESKLGLGFTMRGRQAILLPVQLSTILSYCKGSAVIIQFSTRQYGHQDGPVDYAEDCYKLLSHHIRLTIVNLVMSSNLGFGFRPLASVLPIPLSSTEGLSFLISPISGTYAASSRLWLRTFLSSALYCCGK